MAPALDRAVAPASRGGRGLQPVFLEEASPGIGIGRRSAGVLGPTLGEEPLHERRHGGLALRPSLGKTFRPALGKAFRPAVLVADAGLDASVVLHGEKRHHALLPCGIDVDAGHLVLNEPYKAVVLGRRAGVHKPKQVPQRAPGNLAPSACV